jgi:hypothetical protein
MTSSSRGSVRRHLPLILFVVFVVWIALVIVLIAVKPGSATQ